MSDKSINLKEAVELTVKASIQRNQRPRYTKEVRNYLKQFAKGREHVPIGEISAQDIDNWFAERKEKPITRKGHLGRLGAMFAYAVRKKLIKENPLQFIERVTVELGTPAILNVHQCQTLLEFTRAQHPRVLPYLILCLFSALRPSESQRMIWPNIDLTEGLIRVDPGSSKIRSVRRFVTILPATRAWLDVTSRENSLPLKQHALSKWLKAATKCLGLERWPQDCLRHSGASFLLASCGDESRVATQLGTSPAMLRKHYLALVKPSDAHAFFSLRPTNSQQLELTL